MTLAPVVFDAYGTQIDTAALAEPLEAAFPGGGRGLAAAWRATQLRHTWLRSLMGAYLDFDTVTAQALEQVLGEAGLPVPPGLVGSLLARYRRLPPYADAVAALAAIEAERPVAILTNGRRATVEATVSAAGLAARIPVVLSVEDVGVFKPAPAVYALAADHFRRPAAGIWFVSGNAWDCAGAGAVGLRVVRVRRSSDGPELVGPPPVASIGSLLELASVLGADLD
jgi:2-haloacid dehalogenase